MNVARILSFVAAGLATLERAPERPSKAHTLKNSHANPRTQWSIA
jgi:hypothetical protein